MSKPALFLCQFSGFFFIGVQQLAEASFFAGSDESTRYCMSPERAMEYVDENTIGVFVILGKFCV